MSKLDVVAARNKELVKSQPITAVFAGGTSGIGEYALRALASTNGSSGQGLRVYIVGRNQSSANAVISDCQSVCPAGEFYFVHSTDLSLCSARSTAFAPRLFSKSRPTARNIQQVLICLS
jgi:NAD(P)-dependent dehydrogenase (short-subunit alcohol dehydrogenase family)